MSNLELFQAAILFIEAIIIFISQFTIIFSKDLILISVILKHYEIMVLNRKELPIRTCFP